MGNLTVEEAILKLKDNNVEVRKEAIKNLYGVKDEAVIDPLIDATTDENTNVRFKAAQILGTFGDVAVNKLIDKFNTATGSDKRYLIFALKETHSPNTIDVLVSAVNDEDPNVRKTAIRGLGALQARDKMDYIASGLNDDDWGVRLYALYALGDLATPESIALIKQARRKEKDKDFKKSCNKTIKKAEKVMKEGGKLKPASKAKPMKDIKVLEKEDIEAAAREYEVYVKEKATSQAPYKRLCILYRKMNKYDDEVRTLNAAIETLSKLNPGKEDWFQKRLDKLTN